MRGGGAGAEAEAEAEAAIMAGESSGVVAGSLRARGGETQRRRGDDGEKQKAAELHGTGQRRLVVKVKLGRLLGRRSGICRHAVRCLALNGLGLGCTVRCRSPRTCVKWVHVVLD